jgi:hypothetical protein
MRERQLGSVQDKHQEERTMSVTTVITHCLLTSASENLNGTDGAKLTADMAQRFSLSLHRHTHAHRHKL